MPPRKEVYHEKQEVGSTVWITFSFVDESQCRGGSRPRANLTGHDRQRRGQPKLREDHLLSPRRDAKVHLHANLARGGHSPDFVQYPWSDDSVHLEQVLLANIPVSAVCDQRCGADSVREEAWLAEQLRQEAHY